MTTTFYFLPMGIWGRCGGPGKMLGFLLLAVSAAACRLAMAGLEWHPERLPSASALNRGYFRSLSPEISDDAFRHKWKHALKSPEKLFSAFPQLFYDNFSTLSALGPVGPCFGDPHYKNFGYLRFEDGSHFVFNDLDDSGLCPVALDALRFLVSLELDEVTDTADLPREYQALVRGEADGITIDDTPDLDATRRELLKEETHHGRFRTDASSESIGKRRRERVLDAVRDLPFEVEDVATYEHRHGGSAGLERDWLLVRRPSYRQAAEDEDILELKREVTPATARGPWGKTPAPRIEWATRNLWPGLEPIEAITVVMGGETFLLRSRSEEKVHWKDLDARDRRRFARAELALLARGHRRTWAQAPDESLRIAAWLEQAAPLYANRIRGLHASLTDELD